MVLRARRTRIGILIGLSGLAVFYWACAGRPVATQAGWTVAVWPIEDLSPVNRGDTGLADLLWGRIMVALQNRGDITVVERQRLDLALEELKLGSSELADESTRLKLGRLIGAGDMVFGGFQVIGGQMRLDLRLVEVETGKVLRSVEKTTDSSDLTVRLKVAEEAALALF